VFLMPYGGRDEIVKAARNADSPLMDSSGVVVEDNGEDETQFREQLMLGDLPDVDLMMRTSEVRLSNFMLYHNAYAEFVFMQKNWPSFTESDFYESMYKYANRDRRFGV
jgi:undecaprenyl diphosphate synthase